MNLFAFLTGCHQEAQPVYPAPVPLPQGAGLTALYITHQGMAAGPYFILQAGEGGDYEDLNAYLPRTDNDKDEVFVYNADTRKIISNLWSKVKIAASNAN